MKFDPVKQVYTKLKLDTWIELHIYTTFCLKQQ
jgi:hypothetical protein